MIEEICSIKHPLVQEARALHRSQERIDTGKALVVGREAIKWADEAHLEIEAIFSSREWPNAPGTIYRVSEGIMRKVTGTTYLIPEAALIKTPAAKGINGDLVVVFDKLQDYGNIGTIVRTAQSFGIDEFVADTTFDWFHKKTIDASRGLVFQSRLQRHANSIDALRALKNEGYQIAVTTPHGGQLQALTRLERKKVAVVFGNESTGVGQDVLNAADIQIQIPMSSNVESLNVAVAAGITLYELQIKVVLAMIEERIHGSLGRNLAVVAQVLRQCFDRELHALTSFSADQAILLMVLACERTGEREALCRQVGITDEEIDQLIGEGYLQDELAITVAGEEALAKIFVIHEQVEDRALHGFSQDERQQLTDFLTRLRSNCVNNLDV